MRQNLEELSATQEELNRKEKEYENIIKTLKEEIQLLNTKGKTETKNQRVEY